MKTKKLLRNSALLAGAGVAALAAHASTDYAPAVWHPICEHNWYTSGHGHKFVVIHDLEGYYASTISAFDNCGYTRASIFYIVNGKKDASSDSAAGAITQLGVREAYYAWHVRCWNQYMYGTEHEGFASNPAWYTETQYVASASLQKHLCDKSGIAKDRNHVIAHSQKTVSAWRSWMAGQGYSSTFINCNTHGDPGAHWNWTHFMDLLKGGGTATPTAPSSLVATTVSSSQIKLTWKDNSGIETGNKVERSLSATTGFAQIGTTGVNGTTYTASSLASGTTYYFRVRAYNTAGNSAYTGVANAVTKDTIPAAPTSLTATAISDTQINLAWAQTMPNEDGFKVYRSTDNVTYTLIVTVGINAVSYSNTGLTGNRLYYYRVYAYNTAGNSAASNTASDTTAPQAPAGLAVAAVAGTTNWNHLKLTWTDNSSAEVGFKVERATVLAGPYTQINTTAAGVATYEDSGLGATTTYFYRVRSYNANGNSAYSAVASRATGNAPPILTAIGNKTVVAGTLLAFTATASDPNAPAPVTSWLGTFEGTTDGTQEQMFRKPSNSASTSSFMDTTATNYSTVKTGVPTGMGGTKAVKLGWTFKTNYAKIWARITTSGSPTFPNIAIALDQQIQFKFYCAHTCNVGIGVRETGTTAAYGADGGTTGAIEWVGVTNSIGGVPIPNRTVPFATTTTLAFNIPFEEQYAFTGDGLVDQSGAKGVLEHIIIQGTTQGGGMNGANTAWIDDVAVVTKNYKTFSLDAGAPSGASIGRRNGKFAWTPTTGQVGAYNVTVRVTDNLGAQDFETIRVLVLGTGNNQPILNAIGSKTVNEGAALAFTASATEYDAGQTLSYSLDAGNPAGSSISSSTGAFTWTPSEAQGPGSYPITVRVTDNGAPASNDFETITVTVNEANVAPVLAAIANQTINQGSTLNLTASATDSDVPANTITYSIAGPSGMTINSSSGAISWVPGIGDDGDVDQVVVTATDNGVPALKTMTAFNVTVTAVNHAPVITIGTKLTTDSLAMFDEIDDENIEGHNNECMFRVPYFSGSTTGYLDSTSYSYVTNDFPRDDVNGSYQALFVRPNFKTGTVSPWCRLTTFVSTTLPTWTNSYAYPNPTINLAKHLRFKVWSDKAIKVAIGVRETGTLNPPGFDGGNTGTLEWLGATTITNAGVVSPVPSRTVTASNWTQLDFDLPAEVIKAFPGSGNGVLAAGNGVLEHVAIVPNAGTGIYNIYVDEFEASSSSTASSVTINNGDTLTLTCSSTDADLPAQIISYSLGAGAPTNAVIDDASGAFTWTAMPDQIGTSVLQFNATDDGSPNLTGSQNLTVIVNKVNTPPRLAKVDDLTVENGTGATVTFDAIAEDDDLPGDTITYSITSGPGSINASTGTYTWTPPAGVSTNFVTIRATDNGTPALFDETSATILVVPTNAAPVLSLGTARATESVVTFETFTNGTPNEQVMFKKPANSSTTLSFIDTNATNYTTVTTSFPAGNANAGAKAMRATWTFKTGTTNYWVRLVTDATTLLPNPTINASARLKFDVYATKAIKVGVGIRETGTAAQNGADGGITGNVEYVGCSSIIGSTPQPTRTVNAATWTTVEFDLPNEPCQTLTGNGILSGGQQVLEHLIVVGAGGTGAYDVYVDNFQVVTTTALPGTLTMKVNSALTFTATATDPDPGDGLTYGIDADFGDAHTNAVMNETNGVFNWTPVAADAGTTNSLTVSVEDEPNNGANAKSSSKTLTVIVTSDTLGAQSGESGSFIAGGDSSVLTWDSIAGATYKVQLKPVGGSGWVDVETVQATGSVSSFTVTNSAGDANVRIIAAGGSSE